MSWITEDQALKSKNRWKLPLLLFVVVSILLARPLVNQNLVVLSASEFESSHSFHNQLDNLREHVKMIDEPSRLLIYSKAYALMDANTAEVLVSKSPDIEVPIASTTKMVTALVARKHLKLDQIATVSTKPPLIEGSKIGLKSGEKITVRNLLQGLLINSGNDAAFSLAETFAQEPGNYSKFVTEMNSYAKESGLLNTVFGDPAGLDSENGHSTPVELAHIGRLVLEDEVLREIVATSELTIASVDGLVTHQLKNSNRLVLPDSPYYLPNAFGIKTGFTHEAGHCLVAAYKWQGRVLLGVVMNTVESTNTASAAEMHKLFSWAENNLEVVAY